MAGSISLVHHVPLAELTQERVEQLLEAATGVITIPDDFDWSVAVVASEDIHHLNKEYRGKDMPTDVLSFPYGDGSGEIVVSAEKVRAQAEEYGHTVEEESAFLVVHGIVHIMGWDHERSEEEAAEQRDIEEEILKACGLSYAR